MLIKKPSDLRRLQLCCSTTVCLVNTSIGIGDAHRSLLPLRPLKIQRVSPGAVVVVRTGVQYRLRGPSAQAGELGNENQMVAGMKRLAADTTTRDAKPDPSCVVAFLFRNFFSVSPGRTLWPQCRKPLICPWLLKVPRSRHALRSQQKSSNSSPAASVGNSGNSHRLGGGIVLAFTAGPRP